MFRLAARPHPCAPLLTVLALIALLVLGARAAAAQSVPDAYRPGEVLIRWAPGASAAEIDAVRRDLGATSLGTFDRIDASHERITRFSVEQAIARYDGDARIRYIEPNYILHIDAIPNDPMFGSLWGLHNTGQTGGTPGSDIHAPQAWDVSTGSSSVLVAIIDTGVDYTHPDLAANVYVNPGEIAGNGIDDDANGFIDDVHGWDFANGDSDPIDDHGHGTHCAGTIGALGGNGVGVVGVNWQVRLLPIKFLAWDGYGTTAAAVSSIEYATQMGVRVMSNSWGGGAYAQTLFDAIQAASEAGIVFVAAAGNSSEDNDAFPHYPSSYELPNIIAVAASDPNDVLAWFSNHGATSVDLAAPGTDILSTAPGAGYQYMSGTSMAAPHVSGAAALVLGRFPGLDAEGVKARLLISVDPVPALAGQVLTGGRLNAFLLLADPDSLPPAPITDVAVTHMDGAWAELRWTATGDDGTSGRATRYEVRFSTAPITAANFTAATRATGIPDPLPAGTVEHVRVDGLDQFATTYHFAVLARDEYGQPSELSNVPSGTTLGPPQVQVAPDSLSADLLTGGSASRLLTVSNAGASELTFRIGAEPVPVPATTPPLLTTSSVPLAAGPFATYAAGATPARGLLAPVPDSAGAGGTLRVLILTCGGAVGELQGLLAAFPDIAQVDVFDGALATPTLDQLRDYHSVILVIASATGDRAALGNVLADYVDGGGGLVFTLASFVSSFELLGRLTSGGYCPFSLGTGPAGSSTLDAFDSAHPIMQGVATAGADLLGIVTVAPGAQWVASWASGSPFVATRGTHLAAVNAYFGNPGYWSGDIPLLMHNAAFWVSGIGRYLSSNPTTGVVAAGGSTDVELTYDATGLNGGDYDAFVTVASNDPVTPKVSVPSHLHVTGAPDLAVSADSLDFGALFIGVSRAESLTVTNRGTDLLTITGLSIAPAAFAVADTGCTLAPGASMQRVVTFTPPSATVLTGTLEIHSDDPDSPVLAVALRGEGLIPPELSVAPDSLSAELFVGEQTTRTLTVTNSGGSALEVELSTLPRPASAAAGASVRSEPAALAGSRAPGARASGPTANDSATPGGPIVVAGEYAGTHLHFGITEYGELMPFQYPNGNEHLMVGSYLSGYTVAYRSGGSDHVAFASYDYRTNLAPVAYQELENTPARLVVQVVTQTLDAPLRITRTFAFEKADKGVSIRTTLNVTGGTDLTDVVFKEWADWDVDADYSDDSWDYDLARNMTYAWDVHYAGIAAGSVPAAMDLNGWDDYGTRTTTVQYPSGPVTMFDGLALLHFELGTLTPLGQLEVATAFGMGDDVAELRAVIDRTVQSTGWLTVAPRSLAVPAHSSQSVTVTFDAAHTEGGHHDAYVALRTNDPLRPEARVPAHLHVIGAPDIALTPDSLEFGSLFLGTSKPETLMVSNEGTDLLTVTLVTVSPADFAATDSAFTLAPGATRPIVVRFTPLSPADLSGTLGILSDDPDEPSLTVALHGVGLIPPAIGVTPDSLTASLFTGDQLTRPVVVANSGGSPLTWSLSISSASAPAGAPAAARGIAAPATTAGERIDGVGLAGPSGPSGLGALLQHQLAALGVPNTVFYDDMEHGDNGWTRQVYGVDDLWHRTTRAFNSPATAWWCGIESSGTYSTGSPIRTAAVSPVIDLRNANAPVTLQFYENFQTEAGWDKCMVDVAADSGSTWTPLRGDIGTAPSGTSGGWRLTMLDLSPWAGRTIRIRFYFDTIDAIGNAYPGWFFDDVLVTAARPPWLAVTPESGEVAAGGSQTLSAVFDATDLPGGDYLATVSFASNDPATPVLALPARLHVTGAPNIRVTPDQLAFGTLFVGASRTDTVVVANTGSDVLTVSSVDVTPAVFHASGAGFTLAPGAQRRLPVTYSPTTPGTSTGSLTVHSDDADQGALAVALSGACVEAPRVAVSPAIFQKLMATDAVATENLRVSNTGGSPLTWSVTSTLYPLGSVLAPVTEVLPPAPAGDDAPWDPDALVSRVVQTLPAIGGGPGVSSVPTLADALTQLNGRAAWLTSHIPDRFDFSEGDSGISILDGGQDMFDGGNFIKTNKAGPVPYSNNVISSSTAFGASYFTRKYPGLFVLAANLVGVTSLTIHGDLGANGTGQVDGAALSVDLNGSHYVGYVKRVFGAGGDASVNHLIILADPGISSHSYFLDTNNDHDFVSTSAPLSRIYYLLMAGNGGAYLDNAAMLGIMKAFLTALVPAPPWLTVSPAAGVVPAYGSSDLSVQFDTRGLAAGTYLGNLAVTSDDPVEPLVTVPVELAVSVVTATEVALVSSSAEPGVARLLWHAARAGDRTVEVQRRTPGGAWSAVGSIAPDGEGYLRFEDRDVAPSTRYGYRLGILEDGAQRFLGETWLEIPASVRLALYGLLPNPAVRDLMVAFSLPGAGPATLELLDLAGRRLLAREVGTLGAGRHTVSLGTSTALPAGVYLVRLQSGDRSLIAKGVVIE